MAIQWTRSSDGSGKEQRAGVRMGKEGTKDLSVIPLIFLKIWSKYDKHHLEILFDGCIVPHFTVLSLVRFRVFESFHNFNHICFYQGWKIVTSYIETEYLPLKRNLKERKFYTARSVRTPTPGCTRVGGGGLVWYQTCHDLCRGESLAPADTWSVLGQWTLWSVLHWWVDLRESICMKGGLPLLLKNENLALQVHLRMHHGEQNMLPAQLLVLSPAEVIALRIEEICLSYRGSDFPHITLNAAILLW